MSPGLRIVPILVPLLVAGNLLGTGWGAQRELIVSVATSLGSALTDLAGRFEAIHPGVKIRLNAGASGALLQQIEKGAPVDLFVSADPRTMDQAAARGLVARDTRKDLVSNELVLIVPAASTLRVQDIKGILDATVVTVAVGKPDSVPVGRYAREALMAEGIWEMVAPRCVFGESARQVLDYVSRGEVDAGLVFQTDALLARDKVRITTKVPTRTPIRYSIAVVSATENTEPARQFLEFLLSEPATAVFEHHGFGKPQP